MDSDAEKMAVQGSVEQSKGELNRYAAMRYKRINALYDSIWPPCGTQLRIVCSMKGGRKIIILPKISFEFPSFLSCLDFII